MMPPPQQQQTHFQGGQYGQTNQYAQNSQPIYDEPAATGTSSGYSGGGFSSINPA